MDAKKYLEQARMLDAMIQSNVNEVARLRDMATSISAPSYCEKVQTGRSQDPPFVRVLERISELEEKINAEIDKQLLLKKQIACVIDGVPDRQEAEILRCLYLEKMSLSQTGARLFLDRSTVFRKHHKALEHLVLPEDAIIL